MRRKPAIPRALLRRVLGSLSVRGTFARPDLKPYLLFRPGPLLGSFFAGSRVLLGLLGKGSLALLRRAVRAVRQQIKGRKLSPSSVVPGAFAVLAGVMTAAKFAGPWIASAVEAAEEWKGLPVIYAVGGGAWIVAALAVAPPREVDQEMAGEEGDADEEEEAGEELSEEEIRHFFLVTLRKTIGSTNGAHVTDLLPSLSASHPHFTTWSSTEIRAACARYGIPFREQVKVEGRTRMGIQCDDAAPALAALDAPLSLTVKQDEHGLTFYPGADYLASLTSSRPAPHPLPARTEEPSPAPSRPLPAPPPPAPSGPRVGDSPAGQTATSDLPTPALAADGTLAGHGRPRLRLVKNHVPDPTKE
ncbi:MULTISPECIES: hypothetical protein [Streptomyces]|uniref:hypothetical protein n=1 Tax=Streptomyces TaxID=1883 RepID=UPI00345C4E28